MTMKRKRKVFQNSEPAYRAFLTKFSENKNFNDECIIVALNHAFSQIFKSQISSDTTRVHLVKIILDSKEKILNDLETLKDSPESKIEPLRAKNKQSNCDVDKMAKKRKLNNASANQEERTSDSNTSNSNKRNTRQSSNGTKNLLTNLQSDEKENQYLGVTSKILKVTIDNDKTLLERVKSCNSKNNKKSPNKSLETDTEEIYSHHETNHEENEKLNVIQDHNESIEIEQSIFRIDENENSFPRIAGVSIKKEIDLLDNSLQGDIPIPLPQEPSTETSQEISNNAAERPGDEQVNNQTNVLHPPSLSVSSQENVSSLNIACYNNFIPSVQPFNNCHQMSNINCYPCQFMHHHMFMNNHFGCCYGMYNFPMINPFFSHSNHAFPTLQNRLQAPSTNHDVENGNRTSNHLSNLQSGLQHVQANQITENGPINQSQFYQNSIQSMQANHIAANSPTNFMNTLQTVQQLCTNQMAGNNILHQPLNTAQEIAKLQTAIFNLNSQLASLKNACNIQSQSN